MVEKENYPSTENETETFAANDGDYTITRRKEASKQSNDCFSQNDLQHHSDKKIASLRLMIPTYLDNQLTQIAANKRVTKRFLILKALDQSGYHIEKEDLVADKRRNR
ncbi:unnamed protein product [Commensalibacter communis]|uniref:Uncharacterized protein n=1 Tax=Commensalibacter communis TaxID=2972786 RepID=A0A9W4XIA5_9PROT|nr:hypothetical protein [Commensalibacter communis]CAI3948913.1 unnamed protein product [Commensalibacter communis]CAI3949412.1 unnamed protein product [Commensalibacter communis]CAI3949468.1 unnamed protein product [Commensalibacter communis]CAI3952663.1 unnamed protein product [Commensalibacter communis]CAI3955023.1 unnamed protein product [Commensalibacter communis]